MYWNRNSMNGAVSSQDYNQQYLQQSTTQSPTPYGHQNTSGKANQLFSQHPVLKQLLSTNVTDDTYSKIEKAALAKPYKGMEQMLQQTNQLLVGQFNTYKPRPEIAPAPSSQSGHNLQNLKTSNYRMVSYTNPASHTAQQPQSVPVMQQYVATGYSDRQGQEPMQNTQASSIYVFLNQNVAQPVLNGYSSVRHPVQTPYQQPMSKTNSQPVYAIQNGNSGSYPGSTNIPIASQDYRNSQNYQTQTATNYVKSQTLPYVNNPQQTPVKWDGQYVQIQQPQPMGNFQNSMQLVTSTRTTAMPQPPPSYTQATTNQPNVLHSTINQQQANLSQNYSAPSVQQPHYLAAGQQEKSSAAPMSLPQAGVVSKDQIRHHNLIMLLQVYSNVRQKYLQLNQNTSNASVGSAPLVSTLQNGPVLANNAVAGQISVPQNGPVVNPSQLNSAQDFQGPTHYNTNGVHVPAQSSPQHGQSFHQNVDFPNQVPTSNQNVYQQNNYSGFNSGQAATGGVTTSNAQGLTKTLRANNFHQNVPTGTNAVHANHQGVSNINPHDGSWSQNGLHVNPLQSVGQSNPVTSEICKTAVLPNVRRNREPFYTATFDTKIAFPSASQETIEAALPLWKSVPQISSLNKDGHIENEPSPIDAFNLLNEMTLPSTNEATSVVSPYKPDLPVPNASKYVEPQIAIVSPLVQSKEMTMLPKGQDVCNVNLKDNEGFNKILQSLRSLSAPLKEEPDNVALSPSNIEATTQKAADSNSSEEIEMGDDDLQISGLCTLVEGNVYYNHSVAMMFEGSDKTESDTATDVVSERPMEHSEQGDMTSDSHNANGTSDIDQPNHDMVLAGTEMIPLTKDNESKSLLESTTYLQPEVERVPTPTENVQSSMEGISMQFPDDGFEVVCDSPKNNIHITLIPQDEITKIFADEPLITVKREETEVDLCPEATSTVKSQESPVHVEPKPLMKGDSTVNENIDMPDKDPFCCLFSWLKHTNRNAPKCNCKVTEPLPVKSSNDDVRNKTPQYLPKNHSPNLGNGVGYELKHHIILPINVPIVEPVEGNSESKKSVERYRCSQQEETKETIALSGNSERVFEGPLEEHKKCFKAGGESKSPTKNPSPNKTKPDVSPKCVNHIVKTDFLKGKHLHKGKRKDKGRKTRDTQDSSDTRSDIKRYFHKSPGREVLKTPNEEKTVGRKIKSPYKSAPKDHSHPLVKPRSSLSSVKTTPTIAKPNYERVKSHAESHFDKTRNVITLQEYLKRKREHLSKLFESKLKQRDETEGGHRLDEKSTLSQRGYNTQDIHKRSLSPAKINVTSKTRNPTTERFRHVGQPPKNRQSTESSHKTRDLDNGRGKAKESKRHSSKDKIYLSPCISSRGPSYEGLNLTKLQIRCSPEKRSYYGRSKCLDSSLRGMPSKLEVQKTDSPKMLKFKLCPEFVGQSRASQEESGEPKAAKEKNIVEGIKSKKEAWCTNVPFKKRKLDRVENQGCSTSSSRGSTPTYNPLEKSAKKVVNDSQATFKAYKQMYRKQQSKSADGIL